jgi:hypothetical protein
MSRATTVLAALSVAGLATSIWLYLDNRSLRADLAARDTPEPPSQTDAPRVATHSDPWQTAARSGPPALRSAPPPALPEQKSESRLERRQRRQAELTALLGRGPEETPEDYRARLVPLIKGGLALPRARVEDMRKAAEEAAHVSPTQSRQLDQAFDKVYGDVLDYTNKAIADGQLSPYERNVSGWLQYAGGLGGFLDDANGQIGKILSPDQVRAMSDSGFEWGEYLGLEAPWEKLDPPPSPKR